MKRHKEIIIKYQNRLNYSQIDIQGLIPIIHLFFIVGFICIIGVILSIFL